MHIIRKTRISTELLADLVDELLFIKNKPEQAYGLVVVYYPDYTRLGIKEFFTTLDDISVAPDGTSINTQTKLSILNFLTYFKNFSVKDIDRFRYFKQEKEVAQIPDSGAKNRANLLNQNQGLIIELLLDLASSHGIIYKAVQSKTYSDLPFLPIFDAKNGNEICIRDLDCIKNIL